MTLKNAVGDRITCYCILDSDYHTSGEILERYQEAKAKGIELHIWRRKEIENYLLHPAALRRVILQGTEDPPSSNQIEEQMLKLCDKEKDTVLDAIADVLRAENRALTPGGANKLARKQIEASWEDPEGKLSLVSGKDLLSKLSAWSQKHYGVSFGLPSVMRKLRKVELPTEISAVLEAIEQGSSLPPLGQ